LWRSTVGELPVRTRSDGELAERVRRAEDYATLGAQVVVELHTESHATKPSIRAWAITRRAHRAHRRHLDRDQRGDRRKADRTSRPRMSRVPLNFGGGHGDRQAACTSS
jgi:hypothetical protein